MHSVAAGRTLAELKGINFKEAIKNAKLVERQTAPVHSGDWRGCKKSPWCATVKLHSAAPKCLQAYDFSSSLCLQQLIVKLARVSHTITCLWQLHCCRCDRETSHRGVCNKKAKVPGTAAWPAPPIIEIQRLPPGRHTFNSIIGAAHCLLLVLGQQPRWARLCCQMPDLVPA